MDVDIKRLQADVAALTKVPRPAQSAELEAARRHVEKSLAQAGWQSRRDTFHARAQSGESLAGINLVATRKDRRSSTHSAPRTRFCLGAHLDSLPETVGADDNASGVAALLEIARLLDRQSESASTVDLELVVFDLEEAGMLGGAHHARRMKESGVELCGMVSLEMIAYRDRRPGSQKLPRTLVGQYPDTGDFIAIIGNQISGALSERFQAAMSRVPGLSVETLAVRENGNQLQASRLSDHSPFWDEGFAALMITDTSFLRNPHYHLPSDTPATLDFEFLALVTQGTLNAVRDL